jgi:nucleoside-diphosphate-sugar epimerase
MNKAVIFGGSGFIGSYLADYLISNNFFDKVYIADIKSVDLDKYGFILNNHFDKGTIEYIFCDVRNPINLDFSDNSFIGTIFNLAAIHREPGHEDREYFDTNLLGAENICKWAYLVDCSQIVFTSSIAPYGVSEHLKDEKSVPVPVSPYGSSKLVAEKIHLAWLNLNDSNRLTIVRPGVVFGAGEGGNVSRLIKSVVGGYFFYMGNKDTRKAGVYVKELIRAMIYVHNSVVDSSDERIALFNMTMHPAPSVSDYVNTIMEVSGRKRMVFSAPFVLVYYVSFVISFFARIFNIKQPIDPVRVRKLVRSNNIVPKYLLDSGYEFRYSLKDALTDWKETRQEEW